MLDRAACRMTESWIFPDWPAPPRRAGGGHAPGTGRASRSRRTSASTWALRSGDDPRCGGGQPQALQQALALPSAPRWLQQVHGMRRGRAGAAAGGRRAAGRCGGDSHVAAQPLAILTADCLPVLFCADDGAVIGAAHAGWRGLGGGVLEATVAAMAGRAGALMAWLGPCIGAASYEVGEEVRAGLRRPRCRCGRVLPADPAGPLAVRPGARWRAGGWRRPAWRDIHGGGFDTFTDPRLLFLPPRRGAQWPFRQPDLAR